MTENILPDWWIESLKKERAQAKRNEYAQPEPPPLPKNWDRMTLDRLWLVLNDPRNHPTPQSTVEAVMLCVEGKRGIDALKDPANVERLSRCDEAAKQQIKERIKKLGLISDE